MTISTTTNMIDGYPKNLSTLNTIKKGDTFVELPIVTANVLMKHGKLPRKYRKKLKELKESTKGKVYLVLEDIIFDSDKLDLID